jgi:CheY-like chemotaxis protein
MSSAARSARRFLVVDDEPDLLSVTETVLHTWGHQTQGFTDPLKALGAFRTSPDEFSVALLDIRMPKMSGPDLAKELVKIRKDLPIVFMTAFEFDPEIFAHLPIVYKNQDVLKKPYAPLELCQVVKARIGASSA